MSTAPSKTSDLYQGLGRCVTILERWELDARRGEICSESKPYYANGVFAGDLRDIAALVTQAQGQIAESAFETPVCAPGVNTSTRPEDSIEKSMQYLRALFAFAELHGFSHAEQVPDQILQHFEKVMVESCRAGFRRCESMVETPAPVVTPVASMVDMAVRRPAWPADPNERLLVHGSEVSSEHGAFAIVRTVDVLKERSPHTGVLHWLVLTKPTHDDDAGVPRGTEWKHSSGDVYTVIGHTNLHSTQPERYPPSIVYVGPDGHVWSRAVSDWSRSMTAEGSSS